MARSKIGRKNTYLNQQFPTQNARSYKTYNIYKLVLRVSFTLSCWFLYSDNVKALFRRAKAHIGVWDLQEAKTDFRRAAELDTSLAKNIQKELRTIDELETQKEKEDRAKFGKLFS